MSEILAPAGDINCAYAAINGGADAIYLGLKSFSARASAGNFGEDELSLLCAYAHALGVRVHVALNTLVKQDELEGFLSAAVAAYNAGADALIIQNIYLGAYLKERFPKIELHLSTQAGVNNVYGAYQAKRYGFSRVILARETPLREIAKITKIIQTEVFIQGALCTCFSGQCYLSSFAGGNSGNRGRCKQPCRKLYSIDRKGFEERRYALSLSDLSVGRDIQKLIDAGVYSFKIEGRMRRPEYVAAAVNYYRHIVDGRPSEDDLSALKRTYNRGNYTKGLAFGQDKSFISPAVQGHIGQYCGTIKVIGGRYLCQSAERCGEGDSFKILRGGREVAGARFSGAAKGGFYLSSANRLMNGDKAFITTDVSLNASLLEDRKLRKITLSARIECGSPLSVTIDGEEFESAFVPAVAASRAVIAEDIVRAFSKVDKYPFEVEFGAIDIVGAPFVPSSALNEFRRQVYASYFNKTGKVGRERMTCPQVPPLPSPAKNTMTAVIARSLSGLTADIGILKPADYDNIDCDSLSTFGGKKFLYVPPFADGERLESIRDKLHLFDGVYCDGVWAEEFCLREGVPLFAGCGFNIADGISLGMVRAEYVCLSKELTFREAEPLAGADTFLLTAGDIKVMDILYCPFERTCSSCDRRERYSLTDEDGRVFPLVRYNMGGCAFELYNCLPLAAAQNFTGALADCTLSDAERILPAVRNGGELKQILVQYTTGHSKNPVL